MKRSVFLLMIFGAFCATASAHEAFTLVSSEKLTLTGAQLQEIQKQASVGKKEGVNLTFADTNIKLVVMSGPEDDMLSYRIQGMRNPNIVMPADVQITLWFVNVDADMRHDIRLGHKMDEFSIDPGIASTVGTDKLTPRVDEKAPYQAQKIVITSNEDGAYKYYCSVRGHAQGGMWGNILVGVPVTPGLKMPEKTKHVHKPGEDEHADMPGMENKDPTKKPDDMAGMDHGGMKHDDMDMKMSSVTNIGDPMERESSGTSWAPDSSPMYARMKMYDGGGMSMLMGTGFIRYTDVGSSRNVSVAGNGDRGRFDAPTMLMAMYSHPIGKKAQIGLRGMFSLDPAIERGFGYPLLYQSGEQFRGVPIHDRQHPHDLFSELAVTYSYKFNDKRSFYLYAGLPGEPALGPPMYLHRVSGMNIPDAPIGHHWQDATHITFGVITAGYSFGKAKFEASAFNGREPDDNRWDIDKPRLDSFSARFSANPTKNLALQISHGYLKNPERSEPDVRILRRTTASVIYNKVVGKDRNWASSFVWGQNYANGERSNSFLWESNYDFMKNAVFGRYEVVKKSGHELVLAHPFEHGEFWLNVFKLGYIRDIVQDKGLDVGLGAMFTVDHNPPALSDVYGGTTHGGWQVYMRFRPSKHR